MSHKKSLDAENKDKAIIVTVREKKVALAHQAKENHDIAVQVCPCKRTLESVDED